eukprot:5956772-Pleurochrysis_carterae.AAC.3
MKCNYKLCGLTADHKCKLTKVRVPEKLIGTRDVHAYSMRQSKNDWTAYERYVPIWPCKSRP